MGQRSSRGGGASFSTSIPGGGGSRLTTIRSSGSLESRALTASWWVAWRRSTPFTSRIRSPTCRPLREARPCRMTCARGQEGGRSAGEPFCSPFPSPGGGGCSNCPSCTTPFCWVPEDGGGCSQRFYLGNEDSRLVDAEGVAGVVTASHDAEAKGPPGLDQADLLQVQARGSLRSLGGQLPLLGEGGSPVAHASPEQPWSPTSVGYWLSMPSGSWLLGGHAAASSSRASPWGGRGGGEGAWGPRSPTGRSFSWGAVSLSTSRAMVGGEAVSSATA